MNPVPSGDVFDHLDEFVDGVSLPAGELDRLAHFLHDGAALGCPGNRDSAPAAKLEQPTWSPDGQHIAFTRTGLPGELRIIVMNGSAKHAVTPKIIHTGHATITAAWSPDGGRIAFDDHYVIYVLNADGSGLRRLAQNATFGSWSPDGRKLIFVRLRHPNQSRPAAAARRAGPDLWVMNADGSGSGTSPATAGTATWAR